MSDEYGWPLVPCRSGYCLDIEGVDCVARESGSGDRRRWVIREPNGTDLAAARRLALAVRIARLALQLRRLEER